ncbi:MAG: DUF2934 domain-containing protein [Planctomycetales bacterium]|nr:DUF2934 domain-containing protein [Planctomycetales bacterium]
MHPHNTDQLLAFYEQRVLPALFQRLDRAFPELEWNWTGDGWKGVKKTDGGIYNRHDQTAVVCNHPWGFVTRAGVATSWLAYVNGGATPQGVLLAAAVRRLADLAGVEYQWQPTSGSYAAASQDGARSYPHWNDQFSVPPAPAPEFAPQYAVDPHPVAPVAAPRQIADPQDSPHHRQAELWETFAAFCHESLCAPDVATDASPLPDDPTLLERRKTAASVRKALEQNYGVDVHRTDHLPLGVYPSATAVHEHLLACGFTQEEIDVAAVVSDARLPGRVVIPWRDSLGRIATIIAEDISSDDRSATRRLYVKGGQRPAAFGLDVALRPASGGVDELILVDHPLDVVFLQQNGLPNVAMMAGPNKTPLKQDWEVLGDLGLGNVTLALCDDTQAAARTCKSLLDACQCSGAPQALALPFGSLETCHGAGDFARRHGLAKLMHLLGRRQHAYQYLAAAIVRRHRPGREANRNALGHIFREAIAFDAAVYTRERETQLDQRFWGEIMAATRISWKSIRPRLRHRPSVQPIAAQQEWRSDESRPEPDVNWINGLLHAAAEEEAEQRQAPWTNDPPVRYAPPRPRPVGSFSPRAAYGYDDIRRRAYEIWEQKGRPIGLEQQCWYEAEQSLRHGRPGPRTNGYRAA